MKKITCVILLIVSFCFILQAQISVGPRGTLDFTTMQGDDTGTAGLRPTFRLGASFQLILSDNFLIRPEWFISFRGSKVQTAGSTFIFDPVVGTSIVGVRTYKYRLIYTDLVMLATFAPEVTDRRFQLYGGPRISRLLQARVKQGSNNNAEDIIDNARKWQYGFELGVGYELDNQLFVGLRFGRDISSLFEETTLVNEAISIELGYRLGE